MVHEKDNKPYVRIKQSTDDLDDIQLKVYQPKSPVKIYQPMSQSYLTPPIDISIASLERNINEKPLRKSSCPDRIKYSSDANIGSTLRQDFSFNNYSDVNILYNSNDHRTVFIPFLTACSDGDPLIEDYMERRNNDDIDSEFESDSYSDYSDDDDYRNNTFDDFSYRSSMESFSELDYDDDIIDIKTGQRQKQQQQDSESIELLNYSLENFIVEIPEDGATMVAKELSGEKPEIIVGQDNDNSSNNNGMENDISNIDDRTSLLDVDSNEIANNTDIDRTNFSDDDDDFYPAISSIGLEKGTQYNQELPVIVIDSASDSINEDEDTVLCEPLGEENSVKILWKIVLPCDKEEQPSPTAPDGSGLTDPSLSCDNGMNGQPVGSSHKEFCENILNKNEKTLSTCSLNENSIYDNIEVGEKPLDDCISPDLLNVRGRSASMDSSMFSPCESIASLNVDDNISMDNSSLGSYIIINSDNQDEPDSADTPDLLDTPAGTPDT